MKTKTGLALLVVVFAMMAGDHRYLAAMNYTAGGNGTNGFFANPNNIVPVGTGNIWFLDCTLGNDTNDGKSPATAVKSWGSVLGKVSDGTNDVIGWLPTGSMSGDVPPRLPCHNTGTVNFNKSLMTVLCANTQEGAPDNVCETVEDTAHTSTFTVSASFVKLIGITADGFEDDTAPITVTAHDTFITRAFTYGAFNGTTPAINYACGASACSDQILRDSVIIGGIVKYTSGTAVRDKIERVRFAECDGGACIQMGSGVINASMLVVDSTFEDSNASAYTTLSAGDSGNTVLLRNDSFNVTGGVLTKTQLGLPAGGVCEGCTPAGDVSSIVTVNKTITSSAVKLASPTNILTASGDVYVNSIVGMTDATGLVGCTNYVIKQDRAIGATTVASQAITGLGAGVTFNFAGAGTTALLPFSLASGGHIQDQATAGDCTGTGTIQLSVTYTRLTPYASLQ